MNCLRMEKAWFGSLTPSPGTNADVFGALGGGDGFSTWGIQGVVVIPAPPKLVIVLFRRCGVWWLNQLQHSKAQVKGIRNQWTCVMMIEWWTRNDGVMD